LAVNPVSLGDQRSIRRPHAHTSAALRVLAAGLIVGALLWYGVIDLPELMRLLSAPTEALISLALLAFAFVLGGVRWFVLLRALRLPLGFRKSFEIYAIGAFFNTFLPGGTGGDVVRVFYTIRGIDSGRVRALASVVADRIAGLYGMLVLALILMYLNADAVASSAQTAALRGGLLTAFATMTVTALLAVWAAPFLSRSRRVQSWAQRGAVLRIGHQLVASLALFRGQLSALAASTGISLLISLMLVASVVTLASAPGWDSLTPLQYACAAVFAFLASAIPLTPGGIGIAEGAFSYVCLLWSGSVLAYGTIFLGYRLLAAVVSLLGAIAFITHRRSATRTPHR